MDFIILSLYVYLLITSIHHYSFSLLWLYSFPQIISRLFFDMKKAGNICLSLNYLFNTLVLVCSFIHMSEDELVSLFAVLLSSV